jgi:hypothetical protein
VNENAYKRLNNYKKCNISVEFSKTYPNRFPKPYFQPDFSDETTLVATILTQK